jgi:hypothetical protein
LDATPATKTSTVGKDDPVLYPDSQTGYVTHLFDLKTDRYFDKGQVLQR